MNKLIFADSAGPAFQRVYNNSHYALAALLPASLVSPQVRPLGGSACLPAPKQWFCRRACI